MRDPARIEKILSVIREIWYRNPDLRLSQLIMNALGIAYDPYYIEDDDLLIALQKYKKLILEGN